MDTSTPCNHALARGSALCWGGRLLCILAAGSLLGGCRSPGRSGGGPIRAVWVTRWDYKTPADIASVMDDCRSVGFNTVLFQVRGNGTALYRSKMEPWSKELGGRDPGFDPLMVACKEAKRRGLSLHAWVNVMPGWRGKAPPADPRQLYNAHPDWFWRDAQGRRQPLGWYNSLNPCYPEVRRYIVAVMREIVAGYPVDGLHMDYVRFPNEWNNSYPEGARVPDYPRDPRTLAMFRRATGMTPKQSPQRWNRWRTEQVTQLVREIRAMMRNVKPGAKLTAAVGSMPAEARRRHFQDAPGWIKERLVDAVYPMNYSSSMGTFDQALGEWSDARRRLPVVTGIMFDARDGSLVTRQIERAIRTGGHFSAFAYNSLFDRRGAGGKPKTDSKSADRRALRDHVARYLRTRPATQVALR